MVRKLIPLYDGVEIEFTSSWCHARFLSLERAQRWPYVDTAHADQDDLVVDAPAGSDSDDWAAEDEAAEDEAAEDDEPEPSDFMEESAEGDETEPSGFLEVEFRGEARVSTHRSYDPLLLSRPRLIKLLSLLTFLTGRIYATGSPTAGAYEAEHPPAPDPSLTRFVADGRDRSDELVAILEATSKSDLGLVVFSVMDRWRKGRVLAEEPDMGTQEEAMLCYFHILESVGHHYRGGAESEIRSRVDAFVTEVTDAILLPDLGARPALTSRLRKDFFRALASLDSFGARAQIAFALNKLGLLDSKTAALLSRLVKARNAIAHGRPGAAMPMQTWPVRPFFQHTHPRDEDLLGPLTVLSARTIAALCRAATWSDVWEEEKAALHPPDAVVKAFLDDEVTPTPADFEAGLYNGVRPTSVALYWLRKLNKRLAPLEQALGDYLKNVTVSDANVLELLMPALLLADSEDQSIQAAARRAVQAAWTTNALDYVEPSDVWKEITVYGVEPAWLTSWARSGGPPKGEAGASDEASE